MIKSVLTDLSLPKTDFNEDLFHPISNNSLIRHARTMVILVTRLPWLRIVDKNSRIRSNISVSILKANNEWIKNTPNRLT